jgi:hypothetical protein
MSFCALPPPRGSAVFAHTPALHPRERLHRHARFSQTLPRPAPFPGRLRRRRSRHRRPARLCRLRRLRQRCQGRQRDAHPLGPCRPHPHLASAPGPWPSSGRPTPQGCPPWPGYSWSVAAPARRSPSPPPGGLEVMARIRARTGPEVAVGACRVPGGPHRGHGRPPAWRRRRHRVPSRRMDGDRDFLLRHADRITAARPSTSGPTMRVAVAAARMASLAQPVDVIAPIMTEPGRRPPSSPSPRPPGADAAGYCASRRGQARTSWPGQGVLLLHATATHAEEAGTSTVFAVNRSRTQPLPLKGNLRGSAPCRPGSTCFADPDGRRHPGEPGTVGPLPECARRPARPTQAVSRGGDVLLAVAAVMEHDPTVTVDHRRHPDLRRNSQP